MAKTLEQLAQEIYNECLSDGEPISMEDATEMAKMELGAKEIKNYTQSTVEKKKQGTRQKKVDEVKVAFVKALYDSLVVDDRLENLVIKNPQKEVTFTFNGLDYSITLTQHRPPKK